MINSHGRFLITAFIAILIGVVLIQSIGNNVERVKLSSYTTTNETVTLSNVLTSLTNESLVLTGGKTGTLANYNISTVTEIRNASSNVMTAECNVTFSTGGVVCNTTATDNANQTYFDYTYVSGKTGNLAETDEIISLDALRNVTSRNILGWCNITLTTGALVCNNTLSFTCYADYQYDTDEYVASTAARTLLTLTVLFFAIAILLVGVGFVWKSFRESKLM